MSRPLRSLPRHALLLMAFFVVPAAALAQGPVGPHGGPPPLAAVLLDDLLHAALGLSSGQEALWVALDAEDANQFAQMQASRESTRATVEAELAKEAPDLVLIEAARANQRSAAADAMAKLDGAAVALYASLDADQQSAVIAAVRAMHADRASRGSPPARP